MALFSVIFRGILCHFSGILTDIFGSANDPLPGFPDQWGGWHTSWRPRPSWRWRRPTPWRLTAGASARSRNGVRQSEKKGKKRKDYEWRLMIGRNFIV